MSLPSAATIHLISSNVQYVNGSSHFHFMHFRSVCFIISVVHRFIPFQVLRPIAFQSKHIYDNHFTSPFVVHICCWWRWWQFLSILHPINEYDWHCHIPHIPPIYFHKTVKFGTNSTKIYLFIQDNFAFD